MRNKRLVALATFVVGTALVAACGSDAKESDDTKAPAGGSTAKFPAIPEGPIKFGVSVPLSGPTAAFGTTTKKAFEEVTTKQFNTAYPNGIGGRKIEVVVYDDGGDVTKAVNVANQMVQDKIAAAVTLSYNPAASPQQLAVLNKAKIPVLASLGETDYTDVAKYPYFFGVSASLPMNAKVEAAWVAKHPEFKKLAVMIDGLPTQQQSQTLFETELKKVAPSVTIAKTASITPGATDVSTAVATLRAENPDLLIVRASFAFGPIWNGLKAANWSPKMLTSAGAWYDGFDVMQSTGNAANAVAAYVDCLKDANVKLDPQVTALMDGYAPVFGTTSINYLTFVKTDNGPLELLKKAIEKNNSIDGDAIKNALETMGPIKLWNTVDYNFSPTNHFGVAGDFGSAVCAMWPVSNDKYRMPYYAK